MSKISYSRRQVCQFGLCSLAGLSLLGAGTPTVPISKTLRFIFWGPASRDKLTKKATDLYHSLHPDITISSEFTDFSSYWNKLNTEVAGGTIPDLIQMDIKYVAQYAKKGLLLDMTSIIANKTIDLSDFDPSLLASSKLNQKAYGIPTGGNCMCLVYDADLVKKAGVHAPPATMTWEAFAGYTAQLSKALALNKIFGTADSSGDIAVFEIWIRQHGKELFTADGKLGYTAQDVADWFNYWSGLRKSGACASAEVQASVSSTSGPTTSLIIQKKVVFTAVR